MKLRVNLLTAELLPKQIRLTFHKALVGTLLYAALLVAGIGGYQWYSQQLATELKQAQTQQEQLQTKQQQLTKNKATRTIAPALQAQLEDLKKELEIKQKLLVEVTQGAQPEGKAFSVMMEDLASVNENDIWLEQIKVSQQEIALTGYTSNSQLIPNWIAQVGAKGYLQGKTFRHIAITQETPWHKFELMTTQAQEP